MTTTAPPPITQPIRDAARFLQNVPRLTHCTPRHSLVVVPLRDAHATGALRIDLPADGAGDEHAAATAIGMVCRVPETEGVAVVAYDSDAEWPPDGPLPRESLVERVIDRADACGLHVHGAYLVAKDGWGAYGDVAAPLPLSQIVPEAGEALAHDQHDGTKLPRSSKSRRRAVAAELGRLEHEFAAALLHRARAGDEERPMALSDAASTDSPRRLGTTSALPDAFEEALAWDASHLEASDAGLLALAFETPLLRDSLLTQWSTDLEGGRTVLAWQLAWRPAPPGAAPPLPEGPVRLAGEGPRPEGWRLRQGLALARQIAASAPRRARPGALAAASWLSWALGNATHASEYAEQARGMEPGHGLAGIMTTITESGVLPAWAFASPAEPDGAAAHDR
ncbi:DUF4192 family protein [Microbacterium sp. JB110]|uniref:DUF4192 family protein n=1 Tax=Microbacterium sp. JB110 TaxID=2024477 RepID=UPI00097EC575|nr:DUF4192 family protein [Microbacterium sp. JB110]RCS60339.1 DUF4192 family protein [Microbacterium sp. JB110]SJM48840.1 hypothetical protein CZ774_03900 [Frigoribacterium sp. JB110]